MADKRKAAAGAKKDAVAPIEVAGAFLERVTTLPSASVSLLAIGAQLQGRTVSVPFVDLSIEETFEDEDEDEDADLEAGFARIVTLENAAFLVFSLSSNLGTALQQYGSLVGPHAPAEPTRVAAARDYLAKAREELDRTLQVIDALAGMDRALGQG